MPATVVQHLGPVGPVPAGLTSFYGQALSWGGCAPYATNQSAQSSFADGTLQCARVTAPIDYSDPHGKTLTIAVMRVRASDQSARIGSLLVNPGGPGGSGMELVANMLRTWTGTDLAKRFDLIGFDPRGIGASTPAIRCLTGPQQDAVRVTDLDDETTPAGIAAYDHQQKSYAESCARNTGDGTQMLANVGTRDVVKDMDVLRSTLGDRKLTYLGYSYGTLIGTTYAEQFPKNVRALVLDGAVDPTQSVVDETVNQGTGFQTAFTQFAAWCAKQQHCALGRDPKNATQAYRGLVNPLLTHPVAVGDGRRLSYDDATTGTIQALYSQSYWGYLNNGLNDLQQGRGSTLMTLADVYDGRDPTGTYSNEQDAFNAIRCVDDPPVTDPTLQLTAAQRYKQVAPFLDDGRPATAQADACTVWPVPPTGKPHTPSVPGLPPVLVVSTTNDPATPYQAGVNLAKALGGGLLTFEGTQHTAFLQGIGCVDRAGTDYLINLTLPPAGTRCTR
ncbi:MAG TPA: alpha/beta hydrolase [Pseudonocardiaceae bacterium]|nr:alpha/beta hydrolase [Pseudonocardiaceae bacterium]